MQDNIEEKQDNEERFSSSSIIEKDEVNCTIEEGWEFNRKHIFILSSSGKPIYSRYGDEQELVTTFGLLQAVVSIIEDSGDQIKCIKAGKRRIVYFIKHSFYFISVSSTGEPEAILFKQLEFMHNQILLVLSSKVHDMLRSNQSKDIRDLLGSDTTRWMSAACESDLTPLCIAFEAVKGFTMEKELRSEISSCLQTCVNNSGAALGVIVYKDSLLSYCLNESTNLPLKVSDVLLLTNFVGNSSSLRGHDQNWVPICLPTFNANGFLQAYICNLKLVNSNKNVDLSLVLISSTAEASMFKELHEGREYVERLLTSQILSERVIYSQENQETSLNKYLETAMCLHFTYKMRFEETPAQCVSTSFLFPLDSLSSQERILTQYQRLGICMRRGTSSPECTLLNRPNVDSQINNNINKNSNEDDAYPSIMTMTPSSDHALAYVVLDTGLVVVGLATSDSELYATFPGTVGVLESCGMSNFLSRTLKIDSVNIFCT